MVPGGRAATRVTEFGHFDHGAQYFTVQNHRFDAAVSAWNGQGTVQPWHGRMIAFSRGQMFEKGMSMVRHVAQPAMSDLGRTMAAGLDVRLSTKVDQLERRAGLWQLRAADGRDLSLRGFDAVVLALPSTQAAPLLQGHSALAQRVAEVTWAPSWAGMLALAQPSGADFDGAFINDDPILGWVARDSGKPQRPRVAGVAERWTLHANPRWSEENLELDPAHAAQWLLRAFSARVGRALQPRWMAAHRWRYATPVNPLPQLCLWDADARIGCAGDWCGGPRVEGAYLSGLALAEAMLD